MDRNDRQFTVGARRVLVNCAFLAVLLCAATPARAVYWDEIPSQEQAEAKASGSIPLSVRRYVARAPGMSPKEKLFALDLMAALPDADPAVKAFYFHLFNERCLAADGEQTEVMGKYCIKAMLSDPAYVVTYLKGHPELHGKYALFMGTEFYFKVGGLSSIEYGYDTFRREVEKALGEDEALCGSFGELCTGIEAAMKAAR